MNLLIIGGGGREHALAWKLSQSAVVENLYVTPGNPGTAGVGKNIDLNWEDFEAVKAFCLAENIKMVVIGPEAPLVAGLADALQEDATTSSIKVIGPKMDGAILEGSKSFAKEFMIEFGIPTADYLEVKSTNLEEGLAFIDTQKPPIVLKADGLAAGKGVLILDDKAEAKDELKKMLAGKFGKASETVVIEEFLTGIEFSYFILLNKKNYVILPEAKDYKRIGEGDTGLNTGGMGAVSPVPFCSDDLRKTVLDEIITPTVNGLETRGIDYTGFIFFGLILTDKGPKVIEYNCRMGDPETEAVLPRIEGDLGLIMNQIFDAKANPAFSLSSKTAVTVVLTSGGYPEAYEKGKEIIGMEPFEGQTVFQAGTRMDDGILQTNGGRVIAITSLEDDIQSAIDSCMQKASAIDFDGKYYRKDIGKDLL